MKVSPVHLSEGINWVCNHPRDPVGSGLLPVGTVLKMFQGADAGPRRKLHNCSSEL